MIAETTSEPGTSFESRGLIVALALISAAVTAQQIALMQVLGWMHWHHFAYMVVSIALLGFGVAGTWLTLDRARLLRTWWRWLPWSILMTAISMPIGVRLAQVEQLTADLPLIFFDPRNVWRLALLCLLLLPPFLGAGLATGAILTAHAERAGRFYAASLAGAGGGGLLGLLFAATVAPPKLPVATAALALAGAGGLWSRTTRSGRVTFGVGVVLLLMMSIAPGELVSSQFKPLRRTLDLPGAEITASRPSVHGWLQVVAAPALRPAPSVSFEFQGEIPPQPIVYLNGIPVGSILSETAVSAPEWLDYTTDAAAFHAGALRTVALLENGPGGWAALSAHRGAKRILVAEPNGELVRLLSAPGPAFAPEWSLPGVEVVPGSGREFLVRTSETFDLVRFPTVGTLGGGSGLGSASEQFLLTREAFVEAWNRLGPDGIIAVTAWMDFPERNPLRLLATLAEAIEAVGASARSHLAAVRGWATVTFLVRRRAWTDVDALTVRKFCDLRGFDPLLLPSLQRDERERQHVWQNPQFFAWVDLLVDGPRDTFYRERPFTLSPATDQRPYFSQFMHWGRTGSLRESFGARATSFFELGSLVVALTFGVLSVLAAVCVLVPLIRIGWRSPGKAGVVLYFAGLGAGFMAVEIGLMLHAQAWLGSPVTAAAAVITVLLVASGIGSLWSERISATPKAQRRAVLVIAGAVLLTAPCLRWFGAAMRGAPFAIQLMVLIGLVGALGLALGRAFPIGLRFLQATRPVHVPWAWAINGCVSVATPAGAMLLAMNGGFDALLLCAAAAYAVAVLGAVLMGRTLGPAG